MRNGFLISLVSFAFAAGLAYAQDEPPQKKSDDQTKVPAKTSDQVEPAPQKQTTDAPPELMPAPRTEFDLHAAPLAAESPYFSGCDTPACDGGAKCWASLEYLLWWIKDGPVPAPLVTTGNPAVDGNNTGALGQSTTHVLFGQSDLDYGTFSGVRLTVGGWLTADQTFGIEASGFLLEQRSVHFSASSDAIGNPPLYIPAFNPVNGQQDRLVVSEPFNANQTTGGFAGSVNWDSTTRLWGTEVNGVFGHWCSCDWEGSFLAGFRYLDLQESLGLENTTTTLPVNVGAAVAGDSFVTSLADLFETRNQFYGGQIGAKLAYNWSFLSVDLAGKVALGDTHQVVNITGVSSVSGAGAPIPPGAGTFPGGLFAQPTNMGRQSRDEFTVVPEVDLKVSCCICPGVRAFVGYDFLYWNQVVRPGSEIDRSLNLTQSPAISQTNGTLVGPASPTPLFNRTDFYANGVTFGLELRY